MIEPKYEEKRDFFDSNKTKSYDFRINALRRLLKNIEFHEKDILDALYLDFKKPKAEGQLTEVFPAISELRHTIKHLKRWMKSKPVGTPWVLMPSKSKIKYDPKGVVLVISPWNYPFLLAIDPLTAAVAAGNCVVLKPANETSHVADVIETIIDKSFDSNHVSVVKGEGAKVGNHLMDTYRWDHIFFTGSPGVGAHIMAKAAPKLTPVTLELGGKSPAIVDESAKLKQTARKITWGKFLNSAQTCVAPDHVIVHSSIKDELIEEIKNQIHLLYGNDVQKDGRFARMINQKRYDTVMDYMKDGNILYTGDHDREDLFIHPTIMEPSSFEVPVMREEIFGPILPIISYNSKEEIVEIVRKNRYPLSLYVFSERSSFTNYIHDHLTFGGGCVNSCIIHLGNNAFGFGGVQKSGMGQYHGKVGFETFSHAKSILKNSTLIDPGLKYQPYSDSKMSWVRRLFKL